MAIPPARPEHPEPSGGFAPMPPIAAPSTPSGRPFAGFGYRVAAYLFDVGLAMAIGTAVSAFAGDIGWIVAIAVWLLITTGAMTAFGGQTVGKRLAGTQVISRHGTPAGFGTSVLRDQLARLLYFVPLFFLVDSIWAAASDTRQTLRDKMVSTVVVRDLAAGPGRALAVGVVAVVLLGAWVEGREAINARAGDEPGEGYTDADRRAFVSGCRDEGTAQADCECLYEYISDDLSYDEYASLSDDIHEWPPRAQDVAVAANERCVE
jgi:uncharacterized RDD family membrane protein YckC